MSAAVRVLVCLLFEASTGNAQRGFYYALQNTEEILQTYGALYENILWFPYMYWMPITTQDDSNTATYNLTWKVFLQTKLQLWLKKKNCMQERPILTRSHLYYIPLNCFCFDVDSFLKFSGFRPQEWIYINYINVSLSHSAENDYRTCLVREAAWSVCHLYHSIPSHALQTYCWFSFRLHSYMWGQD